MDRIKRHTAIAVILAAIILIVPLSAHFCNRFARESRGASPASSPAPPDVPIVLDAGHGGMDGGAVAADGTTEKTLNLDVAKTTAALLRFFGKTVILTRETDVMLDDGSGAGRKTRDLRGRLAVAREAGDCLFVSIHMNSFPDSDCRGLQIYYSDNNALSLPLAEAVMQSVTASLPAAGDRPIKRATSAIYLLHHIETPAVLIECGFLSNADDTARLKTKVWRDSLSAAFAAALIADPASP